MSNADLADFATKEKTIDRPRSMGWIAPALAWGLVLATLALAVPKFEAAFRDFGVDLSWMMKLIVGASHLWPAVLGVVVVLVVVDSIVLDSLMAREGGRRLARRWSALMLVLPFSVIGFMVVALVSILGGVMWKLTG
jgi:type II secretory pathway component PulF